MQVCAGNDKNFVVINQKGIDPPSLDMLAREGVRPYFLKLSYSFFFFLSSLDHDIPFTSDA